MRYVIPVLFGLLLIPSVSSAATLNSKQVSAIIEVLQAFGVDSSTIQMVQNDLAPVSLGNSATTTTPPVYTPPTTSFSPIQTTTPDFGAVTVQQAPAPITVCDDTPTINVSGYTRDGAFYKKLDLGNVATSTMIDFQVTASSSCKSNWLIDFVSIYPKPMADQRHYDSPSVDAATFDGSFYHLHGDQSFYLHPEATGTYPATFVAHDGNTTATSTVNVVVQ